VPLPNAEHALLDPRKLLAYLLSDTHPVGRHKARCSLRWDMRGRRSTNWRTISSTSRAPAN